MSSTKIKIIYPGRRVTDTGLSYRFLDGTEVLYWAKANYHRIGYAYEADRTGDKLTKSRDAIQVGDGPEATEEQIAAWEAEDMANVQIDRQRKAAKRMEKNPAIADVAAKLKPFVESLNYSEQLAFVQRLVWLLRQ